MGGEFGCYNRGGIEEVRNKFPAVAEIPFSSDVKFNLLIRDSNPGLNFADKHMDTYWVYMKGAPERIIGRCSTMLVNGMAVKIDEKILSEINSANDKFGAMGERVLAFARLKIDPAIYQNQKTWVYNDSHSQVLPFDVKNWKSW
jgi:magnesium-transporting ATPase (P-type)